MDLPPLQKQTLESIVAQSTRSNGSLDLQQLVARLPEGSQLHALVQDVQILDAKARAQLEAILQKLSSENVALKTLTTNEKQSRQANTNTLNDAQALLKNNTASLLRLVSKNTASSTSMSSGLSPKEAQLFAITLKLMGKTALTFSNIEVSAKQRVTLTIGENGFVTIKPSGNSDKTLTHNNPASQTTKAATSASTTVQTNNQAISKAQNYSASMLPGQSTSLLTKLSTETISSVLNQGLRQHLPLESSIAQQLNTLQQLVKELSLPGNQQAQIKELALIKALLATLDRAPSLERVSHQSTLRSTLQNSGAYLENKLLTEANKINASKQESDITNNPTTHRSSERPNNLLQKDLKLELLKLLDLIQQHSNTNPTNPNQNQRPLIPSAIDKLIQSLFTPKPGASSQQQSSANSAMLAEAIKPNILAAIARITVFQLRHLTQSTSEGAQSVSGGFMEIPIKVGEQFVPLILHIQEKPNPFDEKENSDDKKRKKDKQALKKRWHIFMEFDLDKYGKFASDIDYCEPQVKTQIWVEQTPVWELTQKHLPELKKELENSGVEVEELSCHKGQIPRKEMKIEQHLVDIRT